MEDFSLRGAWSKGLDFFSGNFWGHVLLLVGIGIAVPLGLQFALIGEVTGMMGQTPAGSMEGGELTVLIATLGGYVLQLVSFFASWRLGFGERVTLAAAALYGLVAGLMVAVGTGAVLALLALGVAQLPPEPAILLGAIFFLIVFALYYTAIAVMLGIGVIVLLVVTMILGMVSGDPGMAATLVGGSGMVVVMLIVLAGLMLWLAARFSCMTCIMAHRRSVNAFAAIAESWRLTWEDQWLILRYLALIGFGLVAILFLGSLAAGYGMTSLFEDGTAPEGGIGATIIGVVLGIPLAFLTVMIPAGIYRERIGPAVPTDVFA